MTSTVQQADRIRQVTPQQRIYLAWLSLRNLSAILTGVTSWHEMSRYITEANQQRTRLGLEYREAKNGMLSEMPAFWRSIKKALGI